MKKRDFLEQIRNLCRTLQFVTQDEPFPLTINRCAVIVGCAFATAQRHMKDMMDKGELFEVPNQDATYSLFHFVPAERAKVEVVPHVEVGQPEDDRLLSVDQVKILLNVNDRQIRNYRKTGILSTVRLPGVQRPRFRYSEIKRLVANTRA